MSKPTSKPDWINDDDPAKITAPDSSKQLAGWLSGEKPVYQYFNWFYNIVSKWIAYLETLTDQVPVANGGTGATTANDARDNLGCGTIATQDADSVAISGGSVAGITDLTVEDGGTGASTAPDALVNLGLTATAAEIDGMVADGKYDSKGMILGDGTAGRTLRFITITIENAATASCIDVSCGNLWNGDINVSASNLGYGQSVGGISLSAGGTTVTISNSVFAGSAVLACVMQINFIEGTIGSKETFVQGGVDAGDITIQILVGNGPQNLPVWTDIPHSTQFVLCYFTSE